jgi:aspartate beta-hydroxylase
MQFRGWSAKATHVQKVMADKFPDVADFSNRLGQMHLTSGNDRQAEEAFRAVLQRFPDDPFASTHLGFILASSGDVKAIAEGVTLLKKGLESRDEELLDGRFFLKLGDGLRRLGRSKESDAAFQDGASLGLFGSFWQRSLYNVAGLKAQPLWTLAETGLEVELGSFVDHWKDIRDEAIQILGDSHQSGFTPENEKLSDTGHWSQFDLFRQGQKLEQNCRRAPLTCALAEAVPSVAGNRRGQVKFSVMRAGTHVHAHSGPTNCRLRAHLTLQGPIL